MHDKARKWPAWPMGLAVGLLNGFFGSGGGMVGVPMLRALGLEVKQCHATCVAVILPLAALSAWFYLREGVFAISDALIFLPGGLAGAVVGGLLLPKLKSVWLRRVFGALVMIAGAQLVLR